MCEMYHMCKELLSWKQEEFCLQFLENRGLSPGQVKMCEFIMDNALIFHEKIVKYSEDDWHSWQEKLIMLYKNYVPLSSDSDPS